MTSMYNPEPVISLAIEPRPTKNRRSDGQGPNRFHQGRPDLPDLRRSRVEPDHHQGQWGTPPRSVHRTHERSTVRSYDGQTPGRISRGITQRAESIIHTRSRPRLGPVTARSRASSSLRRQELRVRRSNQRRGHPQGVHPLLRQGFQEAIKKGTPPRLPDRQHPSHDQTTASPTRSTPRI
jgi:hypothetical protein